MPKGADSPSTVISQELRPAKWIETNVLGDGVPTGPRGGQGEPSGEPRQRGLSPDPARSQEEVGDLDGESEQALINLLGSEQGRAGLHRASCREHVDAQEQDCCQGGRRPRDAGIEYRSSRER